MVRNCLKDLSIKFVIISRGRSDTICTHLLLPDFIEILVPTSEKELYQEKCNNPIITIPDEIHGLGQVRNWCLKNFEEETVIMIDDDVNVVYDITGEKSERIEDKDKLYQIIVNAAIMAKDAGAKCFGFSQTDIRKYNGTEPFKINGWVGCCIGVIGKDLSFVDNKLKVDIDFCLKNMYYNRYLWIDCRYYFSQIRNNNKGGNSKYRSEAEFENATRMLKRKWGKYISIRKHQNDYAIKTSVKRKQSLKL